MSKTDLKKILSSKTAGLFGIDLRSLALFRVFLALILLVDLLIRATDLEAFYTDSGVLPRNILLEKFADKWCISFHLMNGSAGFEGLLFLVQFLAGLMLLAGYRTRVACFISWLLNVSLQNRNPAILQDGDVYLRMMLFWGMFLPLGACFSIDALAGPRLSRRPSLVLSGASAAALAQVFMVYFFSSLYKSGAEWRIIKNAVYLALSINQFATPLGVWLRQFPDLLQGLTSYVYWLERVGSFLLFFPFWTGPVRTLMVLAFILLHVGFWQCMELGIFPWIGMCGVTIFLPGWFWEKAVPRIDSQKLRGFHRALLRFFQKRLSTKPAPRMASWIGSVLAGMLGLYVFLWNLGPFQPRFGMPKALEPLGRILRLDQQWNMFSPSPLKEDGWYVIPATLMDGTQMDLFRGGTPVSWDRPEYGSRLYKNDRWRKYMMNLWLADFNAYRLYYGQYLCRHWNKILPENKKVRQFEIDFMLDETAPPGQTRNAVKTNIWDHYCSEVPTPPAGRTAANS